MTKKNIFQFGIIITLVFALVGCAPEELYDEFSTDNWSAVDAEDRYAMAKDLIEKELLLEMTREEIESILGRNGIVEDNTFENRMRYLVGYSIADSLILCIDFDGDGYVTKAYIYQT